MKVLAYFGYPQARVKTMRSERYALAWKSSLRSVRFRAVRTSRYLRGSVSRRGWCSWADRPRPVADGYVGG